MNEFQNGFYSRKMGPNRPRCHVLDGKGTRPPRSQQGNSRGSLLAISGGLRSQRAMTEGADVLLGRSEDAFPLVGSIPTHPDAICPLALCPLVSLDHVAAHTRVAGRSEKVPDEDSCHDLEASVPFVCQRILPASPLLSLSVVRSSRHLCAKREKVKTQQ